MLSSSRLDIDSRCRVRGRKGDEAQLEFLHELEAKSSIKCIKLTLFPPSTQSWGLTDFEALKAQQIVREVAQKSKVNHPFAPQARASRISDFEASTALSSLQPASSSINPHRNLDFTAREASQTIQLTERNWFPVSRFYIALDLDCGKRVKSPKQSWYVALLRILPLSFSDLSELSFCSLLLISLFLFLHCCRFFFPCFLLCFLTLPSSASLPLFPLLPLIDLPLSPHLRLPPSSFHTPAILTPFHLTFPKAQY